MWVMQSRSSSRWDAKKSEHRMRAPGERKEKTEQEPDQTRRGSGMCRRRHYQSGWRTRGIRAEVQGLLRKLPTELWWNTAYGVWQGI